MLQDCLTFFFLFLCVGRASLSSSLSSDLEDETVRSRPDLLRLLVFKCRSLDFDTLLPRTSDGDRARRLDSDLDKAAGFSS